MRLLAFGLSLVALAVLLAPHSTTAQSPGAGERLTVYSSFPLQGAARPQTRAMVNGARLALEQAGSRAGGFRIRYVSLDDSTRRARTWTFEATSANARHAAQDDSTIAYIGEFNSGASAISIPILNEAGIAQVSPSNTATGLTTNEPGSDRGEPHKYYPTGRRSYARITPRDTVQGRALAKLMSESKCRRIFLVDDGEIYGAGIAENIRRAAKGAGLRVTGSKRIRPRARHYRRLARRVRRSGARCIAYGGITANNAVRLFKDLAKGVPGARFFAGDGVAESGFADPREGGVPRRVGRRVRLMVATLAPDSYPAAGRRFFADYARRYGDRRPDPYAIYGYEAMSLVLDAIARGDGTRNGTVNALLATRNRNSVLGTYSIDGRGDTTLTDYGVYRIRGGELTFDRVVRP